MNTEPTIDQMNEGIAEFMNKELYDKWMATDGEIPVKGLKYHTSWDWLIPVIKKVKSMHLDILQRTFVLDYMKAAGKMNSGYIDLDIEKAHKGVYEFLIWFNQQPKIHDTKNNRKPY